MKTLILAAMLALTTSACAKEEPKAPTVATTAAVKAVAKEEAKKEVVAPAENTNCVKKDRNGKCPPLPKSPRPTPKIVESK